MIVKYSRQLLAIVILGLFISYILLNLDKFRPLLDIKFWLLGLIAVCEAMFMVSNGLLTQYILRPFGKYLSLFETTYIALITSVGNFFAPVGAGLAFRAVYLKKKHQVPYSDYVSLVAGNYFIVLIVNSILGLLALFLLRSKSDSHYYVLVWVLVGLLLLSLALALIKIPDSLIERRKDKFAGRAFSLINKLSDGWKRISMHPKLLVQLILLTSLNILLTGIIYWLIVMSLNLNAGFAPLLLFSVFSALSLFLNITPANIGVKEAIFIFSSYVLGFSVSQIILIALIERSVFFLIMLVSYLALRSRDVYAF